MMAFLDLKVGIRTIMRRTIAGDRGAEVASRYM
jgi:hypothetical protein